MNNFIFIYITNSSKEEASKICKYLLDKKLIACGNISKVNSIYRWKGRIVDEEEYVLIAKTIDNKFELIKNEVEKIHSYDVPCIIKIPVNANEKYYDWIKKEIE